MAFHSGKALSVLRVGLGRPAPVIFTSLCNFFPFSFRDSYSQPALLARYYSERRPMLEVDGQYRRWKLIGGKQCRDSVQMGDMEWNTSNAGSEVFCVDVAGVAFRLYAPAPSILLSRTCTFPFAHDVVNNCPPTFPRIHHRA